jgi:hypothetical protein
MISRSETVNLSNMPVISEGPLDLKSSGMSDLFATDLANGNKEAKHEVGVHKMRL